MIKSFVEQEGCRNWTACAKVGKPENVALVYHLGPAWPSLQQALKEAVHNIVNAAITRRSATQLLAA